MGDKRRSERLETDRKPHAVNISCPQGNQGWHPPLHSRNSHPQGPPPILLDRAFSLHSHPVALLDHSSLPTSVPWICFPLFPSPIPLGPFPLPLPHAVLLEDNPSFCGLYNNPPLGHSLLVRKAKEGILISGNRGSLGMQKLNGDRNL